MTPEQKAKYSAVCVEMFNLFIRHELDYSESLSVCAATVKLIGRKANGYPLDAFVLFLDKAMLICPELREIADNQPAAPPHAPGHD